MKLRLPNALRAALAAVATAALPLATTVGTGIVATSAIIIPQALADYTWIGGSMTADSDAWAYSSNWDGVESETYPTYGPQVNYNDSGNKPWQKMIFDARKQADKTLTLTTCQLEGWALKMEVLNGANVTISALKKLQASSDDGTSITVDGTSTLTVNLMNLDGNDGHCANFHIGSSTSGTTGGSVTLNLGRDKGGGATRVYYGNITGNENVGTFTLASTEEGTHHVHTVNLELYANLTASYTSAATELHTVDLANISDDITFGDNAEIVTSGITSENFMLSASALSASKKDAGQYYVYNDNGTIKLAYVTADFKMLTWNGGDLTWQSGTQFTGGEYENGDRVTFTADSNVTLGGAVSDSFVIIKEGANVTLNGTTDNQLDAKVQVDGTLTLGSAALAAGTRLQGTGAFILDSGASSVTLGSQLGTFGGTIDVNSGRLQLTADTPVTVKVHDGGQAYVVGNLSTNFEIEGAGWTSSTDQARAGSLRIEYDRTLSGTVTAKGNAGIQVHGSGNTATFSGTLDGSGTITKEGAGTLKFTNNTRLNHTGSLVIASGKVQFGEGEGNNNSINFSSIQIDSGAQLYIQHAGTSMGDLILNGGTLYSQDQDSNSFSVNSLEVRAKSKIEFYWNGGFNFATATGNADLTLANPSVNQDNQTYYIGLRNITDYNGTIDASAITKTNYTTTLGTINQSAGKALTLNGKFVADAFSTDGAGDVAFMGTGLTAVSVEIGGSGNVSFESLTAGKLSYLGTGSLSITNLAINQELTMGYEGTFSVTNYTLADNVVLKYTDSSNYLTLGQTAFTGEGHVLLDVLSVLEQVKSENGFNLHISSDVDSTKLIVNGLSNAQYVDKDGCWYLKADGAFTLWDLNWGAPGLKDSPTELTPLQTPVPQGSDNKTYLDGSAAEYTAADEGADSSAAVIFGGTNAEFTGNTWLKITSGTTDRLIGGNDAAAWQNSSAAHFVGDSHILMEGGKTNHVIGGNYKDGYTTKFTGDSYISITGNAEVTGSVIGGSVATHGKGAPFEGNTHIFITTLLGENGSVKIESDNTSDEFTFGPNAIIGGSVQTRGGGGLSFTGSTNITVDLRNITIEGEDSVSFGKDIIGGNRQGPSGSGAITHTGDTHIDIVGKEKVVFSGKVVGGDWMDGGQTATMNGSTYMTISGGQFDDWVIGGTYHNNSGTSNISGGTNVTISGGILENLAVCSYLATGEATLNASSATLVMTGGDVRDKLIGGHLINGNGGAGLNATTGDISISISGGTVSKVYGGSYCMRNNGGLSVTQGNITIDLTGCDISEVYAAGRQEGTTKLSTASTTVNFSSGVTMDGAMILSGGYSFASDKSGSTVVGNSTLNFTDDSYSNLDGVTVKDFNVINVANANANITLSTISNSGDVTKTGAGTLTLNGASTTHAIGALTIAEGMVDITVANGEIGVFNKANTPITVLGGGTLRIAHDSMGWSASTSGTIILKGTDADTRATLLDNNGNSGAGNTMSTAISLEGHASIISESSSNGLKLLNASIAATAVDNVISSAIHLSANTNVTIEQDGELAIQGNIKSDSGMGLTKSGAGELTLSGENTYTGATTVSDGTLKVTGSITSTSSVAVSGDGELEISGAEGVSVTAGGITAKANSESGTVKNVTLASGSVTGATSGTGADGDPLKALGEMTSVSLAFTAATTISNVTMTDSVLSGGSVNLGNNVTAVVSYASEAPAQASFSGMMFYGDGSSDDQSATATTLNATPVLQNTTAKGTLTVDVDSGLLTSNAGKTLEWTILEDVTIENGFTLSLGDILKTIVGNGKPVVTLSGSLVGDESVTLVASGANRNIDANGLYTGGLIAGQAGNLVLTITNIPEPTTGTLAVLALAALAARRRRK